MAYACYPADHPRRHGIDGIAVHGPDHIRLDRIDAVRGGRLGVVVTPAARKIAVANSVFVPKALSPFYYPRENNDL
jgi:hypothetical protein